MWREGAGGGWGRWGFHAADHPRQVTAIAKSGGVDRIGGEGARGPHAAAYAREVTVAIKSRKRGGGLRGRRGVGRDVRGFMQHLTLER